VAESRQRETFEIGRVWRLSGGVLFEGYLQESYMKSSVRLLMLAMVPNFFGAFQLESVLVVL
jgi:hypothetical protein